MIHFDVTSSAAWKHRSGLTRVSARLLEELGGRATKFAWPEERRIDQSDWFLTAELFSEAERPGFTRFLEEGPCRKAAIYHDAIPLKLPRVTWAKSVLRHPEYMKLLSRFDRVWAVSEASRRELIGFWNWQGLSEVPRVQVLHLGADFTSSSRVVSRSARTGRPSLLCVGIVEPRKNQEMLLSACEALWGERLDFELHLVGRVNPQFGRKTEARIRSLKRTYPGLFFHPDAEDSALARLYADATACAFPTLAEGCGLPLIEALWMGVPCVHSDLPVLLENSTGGGCLSVRTGNLSEWTQALRRILTEPALAFRLSQEAFGRPLPTWSEAAAELTGGLAPAGAAFA